VSKTLKIVNFSQPKFAVRSGGHSPNPGWSSIDKPGVLIDLQKLNRVTISGDKRVASLGPGGQWGDVFTALDTHDVSVIGGRIPQVGVAEVILEGLIPLENVFHNVLMRIL
jgi:FAD/FMN-containing dehydrogenase